MKRRYILQGLGIFLLYLACTQLGLLFALAEVGISPVWPPSGLALTVALLLGNSYLPIICVSALLSNMTFLPFGVSLTSGLTTTMEVWIVASLLGRFSQRSNPLSKPGAVFIFLVTAAVGTLLGAVTGVFFLCVAGISEWKVFLEFVQVWWLGDLFAIMIVTPLLLSWRTIPSYSKAQAAEGILLVALLTTVGTLVFWGWGFSATQFPIEHICIPLLLWATFRFGERGATLSIFLLSVIAIWGTSENSGPFTFGSPEDSLRLLQLFIGTTCITMLLIAASRIQQRRAESALKYSEALYQSLIENLPLSVFRKDIAGTYTFVNRRFCEVFGFTNAQVIGKRTGDLFEPHLAEKYCADDRYVISTLRQYDTVEEVRSQGKSIFIHVVLTPVLNSEGSVEGVMGALWDVTQREEMQRALKRAMEMADAASVAKSEFLANMSHEIRTPLAAILGFVERMEMVETNPPQIQNDINCIRRSVNHLTELIDDVLDLSKIEAGKSITEKTPFDLVSELAHTYQLLKAQANTKSLFLAMHFDGPIPERVTTDPRRFRQILINIVGNALKFTTKGGVSLYVKAECDRRRPNGRLSLLVKDTGCGIEKECQKNLFNAFMQADASTTRRYGGTGLGLSLSRRLAHSLGGDVRLVESEVQRGSIFEVEIEIEIEPRVSFVEEINLNVDAPAPIAGPRANNCLQNIKVLLAEDGEDNRELVSYFLSSNGAQVDVAVNGAKAITLASHNDYDVILMDIQMPIVDGYTAIRRLRKLGYKRPIVALTAHAMIEEKKKCYEAGCDAYITKPIHRDTLIAAVQKFAQKQEFSLPL